MRAALVDSSRASTSGSSGMTAFGQVKQPSHAVQPPHLLAITNAAEGIAADEACCSGMLGVGRLRLDLDWFAIATSSNKFDKARLQASDHPLLSSPHHGAIDVALRRIRCSMIGKGLGLQDVITKCLVGERQPRRP